MPSRARLLGALAALAALAGCARTAPPPDGAFAPLAADPALRVQIVYVIHGDAGYIWYDAQGKRHLADDEAVAQARRTAEEAPSAEVFIFHQRPTRFLRFFPGSDGTLWHYKKGRLVRKVPYDRDRVREEAGQPARSRAEDGLAAEAALFSRFAAIPAPRSCGAPAADAPTRVLCYFGHGIPVTGTVPFFRSRPGLPFSLDAFSRGLVRFGGPACPPAKPFSLVVLSACHGGTPEATLALSPYADWILASPGELHLSYLDTRALARMARDNPVPYEPGHGGLWGRAVAQESFARLGSTVRTGITISLYETARAAPYLEERRGAWSGWAAAAADPAVAEPRLFAEPARYRDCAANPGFGAGGDTAGVTVFYRAPAFGRESGKAGHSGWECPVPEARRTAILTPPPGEDAGDPP